MKQTVTPDRGRWWVGTALVAGLLGGAVADAGPAQRSILILTTSNNAAANSVEVFRLDRAGTPALAHVESLPTGGKGGAGGNGGILQFHDGEGATANYGSDTVSELRRNRDAIELGRTISLASGCTRPVSVALRHDHLYVAGANCVESHEWASGLVDGRAALPDASAGQVAVGASWAALTLKSGSVWQLGTSGEGALTGQANALALPDGANDTPLGADFWNDVLGFTPAHSPESFALVGRAGTVAPITGPTPAYPANATCWVAKGPGNVWYTGNTPGKAISIFLTDGQGGVFYKSVPLPGAPTDLAVSADRRWLAAIYTNEGSGYVAVFSIDGYGDLAPVATSPTIGAGSFNGVAVSE